jgi:hypothetical protein
MVIELRDYKAPVHGKAHDSVSAPDMVSQVPHEKASRTWRMTLIPVLVTSAPIRRKAPPPSGQRHAARRTISSRGKCSGKGRQLRKVPVTERLRR